MRMAGNGYARGGLRVVQGGGATAEATAQTGGGMEATGAVAVATAVATGETVAEHAIAWRQEARLKGYEGDPCNECGNLTLVRNGTCLKCDTCGATSGCS